MILIIAEGQELIGWRTVPINASVLSDKAKETATCCSTSIYQSKASNQDALAFERKLYLIRKQVEHWATTK